MTGKKTAAEAEPKTVAADDPADRMGRLKNIGGSQSDHWNNTLANQALQDGRYTAEAIARRREISELVRSMKALVRNH